MGEIKYTGIQHSISNKTNFIRLCLSYLHSRRYGKIKNIMQIIILHLRRIIKLNFEGRKSEIRRNTKNQKTNYKKQTCLPINSSSFNHRHCNVDIFIKQYNTGIFACFYAIINITLYVLTLRHTRSTHGIRNQCRSFGAFNFVYQASISTASATCPPFYTMPVKSIEYKIKVTGKEHPVGGSNIISIGQRAIQQRQDSITA